MKNRNSMFDWLESHPSVGLWVWRVYFATVPVTTLGLYSLAGAGLRGLLRLFGLEVSLLMAWTVSALVLTGATCVFMTFEIRRGSPQGTSTDHDAQGDERIHHHD
ncbi:hypothetical protein CRD60_04665 [Bifidobacterium aemilianum]|uniref:Uncharacterized protein n=1 Tax=Bifidobacterium aemilianum TaxID=2493120 RepID=A0A366K803_9BIFI|nr:hypothetical protein [Bifidobacterium aemilianum]RBP97880.1 hypothetical protein CRD60_04665 [Bifidobacterium aemilianum]